MDIEQRAALRKLAEEATPGPWVLVGTVEQSGGDYADIIPTRVNCAAYCYGGSPERGKQEDLEYIAAANPQAILQLLDYIEALEKDAARYRWLRNEHWLVNPVAAVVWKRNDDRNECEWVNTASGDTLDSHIDAALQGETK